MITDTESTLTEYWENTTRILGEYQWHHHTMVSFPPQEGKREPGLHCLHACVWMVVNYLEGLKLLYVTKDRAACSAAVALTQLLVTAVKSTL